MQTPNNVCEPMAQCIFCGFTAENLGGRFVREDQDFIAFEDNNPAAKIHILVIPKIHIVSVKQLSKADIPTLEAMKVIGTEILDEKAEPSTEKRRMGFHIPPFTSVDHLHLHLLSLPTSIGGIFKFYHSKGKEGNTKKFSCFVEIDQAIEILKQGKSISVLPC